MRIFEHVDAEIDAVFGQMLYVTVEIECSVWSREAVEAHAGETIQKNVSVAAIAFDVPVKFLSGVQCVHGSDLSGNGWA
jgi:fucose permease